MKTHSKILAASFGLLMMALASIASANIRFAQPANVQPAVLEQTVAPQPHLTLAYWHRPWACSNRHFRYNHQYECR